jgi:PAS domain S-box-containing protein
VEKYHTWSFVPLVDTDGKTLGLFNPTSDTTASVLARRRQETLRDLLEQSLLAKAQREYFQDMAAVLEHNPKDVPFAICYSLQSHVDGKVTLALESTVGVPENHPSTPSSLTVNLPNHNHKQQRPLSTGRSSPAPSAVSGISGNSHRLWHSDDRTAWPIDKALASKQCVLMDNCADLIKDFPLRQWDELPDSAIVIPFCRDTSSAIPTAVMILGLNLQCPLDTAYEEWIHVLRAQLTSSLSSVKLVEAEQQRIAENEKMARAKTAWFQGAAHELRSPLTLVAGPLDDVLRTQLTRNQRHWLTIAQRNVARIQRLVNALLDFSRIEAGRMQGRFVPVELNRFVSDLSALFGPAIERKRLKFTIQVEPEERTVSIDPTLLEIVLTNLLSNAVKYTESGEIRVEVRYDTHMYIVVSDTGCGIPATELGHVTDRYHRAATALSLGVEGTGIGLALAKEIVHLHQGELYIESQTREETGGPHGSTFTVEIPLVDRFDGTVDTPAKNFGEYGRQLAAEAMFNHHAPNENDSVGSTADAPNDNDWSEGLLFEPADVLLLVDDSADIRDYVRRIFSPYCTVLEARDGVEALEIAKTRRPDLILSDLMMPRMTGQELLAKIRSDPTTRLIPFVLLSAATDEEVRLSALIDYSAEDFLLKPFKPKDLLARVHLHMQLGKRRAYLESQFAQREQELRLLSDYCPSGIIRADSDGKLIYANPTWREYCGMSPEQDINEWVNYVDPATRDRLWGMWNDVVNTEHSETAVTWKWLNGRTVTGTFIRLDRAGAGMKGVLGCLQDITYQEERLFEAEQRRVEAEEAKRQQEMLVDMTSHEIRTPVSAILQCSSLVRDNLVELQRMLVEAGPEGFKASPAVLDEMKQDVEALESKGCGKGMRRSWKLTS